MPLPQQREIARTVSYYRLVDMKTKASVEEQDWNTVLRAMGDKQITHRIAEKELNCVVHHLELRDEWAGFLPPDNVDDVVSSYEDETIYGVVASTDKDHIPNQRGKNGEQKPMGLEKEYVPADNAFIWFLPFGNIIGVMMEAITAVRPRYFAAWLTRLMTAQGNLPQNNFQWDAVPVTDDNTMSNLQKSNGLRSVFVAGKISAGEPSPFRAVLGGGPQLEGAFDVQIKLIPRKRGSNADWDEDTLELNDWFKEKFGDLQSVTGARVKFVPGDDLPTSEVDLLSQRITRKRQVLMYTGKAQSIIASSALSQIVTAYTLDFETMLRLRK